MLKPITKTVLLSVCLTVITSPAIAEKDTTTGFGTLKKFDPKGQMMVVTEYSWDTLDIEDTTYVYSVRQIKLFNIEAITELKVGDEVEFEWTMNSNKKYISKLSKGSMPMEDVEPATEPAPVEPATETAPVGPATTGFGTLKKINPQGQMLITEFNWDTLEAEDIQYWYNASHTEVFNIEAVTELKVGDEVEFEWRLWGTANAKAIYKLSKGSMPMEDVEPATKTAPVEPATKTAPVEPATKTAPVEPATGFGTLKKFDPKGQMMVVTEYSWDTLDIEDTTYVYSVRQIKLFNIEAITELKVGDEIEFEWDLRNNRKWISKISKGSMPMESIELPWDVNAPIDVETEIEPLTEQAPVEPAAEQAPVEPAAEQAPVEPATEQAAVEPATEQTPVEPAVEKAVVEPDTVQTPE